VSVAEARDRRALDQLHDEVGPTADRLAAVEYLGNVGMLHEREGLTLGLEAGYHPARVHAGFEDFQADLPTNGLLLFGDEDQPHAAFADLLQEFVRPDHHARTFADRSGLSGDLRGGPGG